MAIVFAGDNYGNEEHESDTFDLPNSQNEMISQVAAANPNTVVVLNNNSAINMPWLDSVTGVFESFYPGRQIGTGMAELFFGDVDPSGKLPVTFPKSLNDVPANTPSRRPGTGGQIEYSEGLDVGYRWYDAQDIELLFPFGYGLSYTSFAYSDLEVGAMSGGSATVTATARNTGSRAGTDVAQVYVSAPASVGEPPAPTARLPAGRARPVAVEDGLLHPHLPGSRPLEHGKPRVDHHSGRVPDPGR